MKKYLFLALLFIPVLSMAGKGKEKKAVKACFESYKEHILNDRGDQAVDVVSKSTIDYYSSIVDLALNTDSVSLSRLSILDKMCVLQIRALASEDEIRDFTGRGLFIYCINQGLVGKSSVMNNKIGKVKVSEGFAQGQFVVKGKKSPFYLDFYKENGTWKLDLTSLFSLTQILMKLIIENAEIAEDEFVEELVLDYIEEAPKNPIWEPLNKK